MIVKSAVLAPLALVFGTLALGACNKAQPTAQPSPQPSETVPPNAPAGITISDGRLVLPAVKGNPGAVYFTLYNDSGSDRTIESAAVKGAASAMIHQTEMANGMAGMKAMPQLAVPARGELAFKPGGLHVMAMDLDDSLAKGGTTDVTLKFKGGDEATFPVEILAAGDAR